MTTYGPNVEGGGVYSPVGEYWASVSESFPRVSRKRSIEASIAGRHRLDVLPVNLTVDNNITDNYIEFRIPGVVGQFLDLSTLTLEMDLAISKPDGSKLGDADHVIFVNGVSNTLFKSCTCYINEQMVESNALFNYHSFIKMVTTISPERGFDYFGNPAFYFRDYKGAHGIVSEYTENYFNEANKTEKELFARCKEHDLSVTAPLFLDVASLDGYLLDKTDVRIRLELANRSWFLNTDQDGMNFKFKLKSARLWVDRVIPHTSALESLNKSLSLKPMQYIYNRNLHKTYVLSQNQTQLLIENPYSQIIPHSLYMVIVDMDNFMGNFDKNGLYFDHAKLTNIHISINGSTVYNLHSDFPYKYSRMYYETLEALSLETGHTLGYEAFGKGRSLFVFNFVDENVEGSVPLEKSGNLRINLTFAEAKNKNRVILLMGSTTGIVEIDNHRHVRSIVRA